MIGRADSVDFDSSIRQILCVAGQIQTLRNMLREIAKADALHGSRDEVTFGLLVLAHKAVNCSRERMSLEALRALYGHISEWAEVTGPSKLRVNKSACASGSELSFVGSAACKAASKRLWRIKNRYEYVG